MQMGFFDVERRYASLSELGDPPEQMKPERPNAAVAK